MNVFSKLFAIFNLFIAWLVTMISALGYPGIVILMFLESSFFPFPSEVVLPPAGYLIAQGKMSLWAVMTSGILGSLLGALFNYWICAVWGRKFFYRFGKYFFISPQTLEKTEQFFRDHGPISTFIGRLIPGVRQFISLPAGVAKMPLLPFCIYTCLGSGLWSAILVYAGYTLGEINKSEIHSKVTQLTIWALIGCGALVILYCWKHYKKKQEQK